jgi:tRNA threonylcarbamoyladenosine biosynthesis protein TsaB
LNILAIDTATSILSAALGTDNGIVYFEADGGLRHSSLLMDSIDMLVRKAGLQAADLDGVLCMRGPGSFTGLRIGFSTAKGLALSLNIPFASISTLDCMAFSFSFWPGIVIPVINAKKNSFFTALYQGNNRISHDMDARAQTIAQAISAVIGQNQALNQVILTGLDAEMLFTEFKDITLPLNLKSENIILESQSRRGKAYELLAIAQKLNIFDNGGEEENSGPEYIRKSDAELQFVKIVGNNNG